MILYCHFTKCTYCNLYLLYLLDMFRGRPTVSWRLMTISWNLVLWLLSDLLANDGFHDLLVQLQKHELVFSEGVFDASKWFHVPQLC